MEIKMLNFRLIKEGIKRWKAKPQKIKWEIVKVEPYKKYLIVDQWKNTAVIIKANNEEDAIWKYLETEDSKIEYISAGRISYKNKMKLKRSEYIEKK